MTIYSHINGSFGFDKDINWTAMLKNTISLFIGVHFVLGWIRGWWTLVGTADGLKDQGARVFGVFAKQRFAG